METGAKRVVLLTGDLLFGSKVEAMIAAAGAETQLSGDPKAAVAAAEDAALLIVDLTADAFDGTQISAPQGVPMFGFYAHTDDETRKRALAAGFELVVPRSRMMREGEALIAARISGATDRA